MCNQSKTNRIMTGTYNVDIKLSKYTQQVYQMNLQEITLTDNDKIYF